MPSLQPNFIPNNSGISSLIKTAGSQFPTLHYRALYKKTQIQLNFMKKRQAVICCRTDQILVLAWDNDEGRKETYDPRLYQRSMPKMRTKFRVYSPPSTRLITNLKKLYFNNGDFHHRDVEVERKNRILTSRSQLHPFWESAIGQYRLTLKGRTQLILICFVLVEYEWPNHGRI